MADLRVGGLISTYYVDQQGNEVCSAAKEFDNLNKSVEELVFNNLKVGDYIFKLSLTPKGAVEPLQLIRGEKKITLAHPGKDKKLIESLCDKALRSPRELEKALIGLIEKNLGEKVSATLEAEKRTSRAEFYVDYLHYHSAIYRGFLTEEGKIVPESVKIYRHWIGNWKMTGEFEYEDGRWIAEGVKFERQLSLRNGKFEETRFADREKVSELFAEMLNKVFSGFSDLGKVKDMEDIGRTQISTAIAPMTFEEGNIPEGESVIYYFEPDDRDFYARLVDYRNGVKEWIIREDKKGFINELCGGGGSSWDALKELFDKAVREKDARELISFCEEKLQEQKRKNVLRR